MSNGERMAPPAGPDRPRGERMAYRGWLDRSTFWLVLYLACMTALVAASFAFRHWAIETYGTPQAQRDWQQWRDDATRQASGAGPVRRRPPESPAPPALLLMRDYFPTCLAVALLLSSALFATFMFTVRGALRPRAS